jgi:hypothetical protein
VIAARRLQRSFADGFITEEVTDLWEPWMRQADEALNDDKLLEIIQEELSKRLKKSKTRGRRGTTAEVVLRMLLLKHMRGWSFEDLTREVRPNLVYRERSKPASSAAVVVELHRGAAAGSFRADGEATPGRVADAVRLGGGATGEAGEPRPPRARPQALREEGQDAGVEHGTRHASFWRPLRPIP